MRALKRRGARGMLALLALVLVLTAAGGIALAWPYYAADGMRYVDPYQYQYVTRYAYVPQNQYSWGGWRGGSGWGSGWDYDRYPGGASYYGGYGGVRQYPYPFWNAYDGPDYDDYALGTSWWSNARVPYGPVGPWFPSRPY